MMTSCPSTNDLYPKVETSACHSAETDGFLSQDQRSQIPPGRSRVLLWSWIAQAILFLTSLFLFAAITFPQRSYRVNCVEKHSMFSPALDVIQNDYQTWRFNGTFRFDSPYKGPPSASVDAAWDKLTDVGVMSISPDTLRKIGASKNSVELPPESGGGYMGYLEVFHQIHCVNLLWQGTNEDYYKDKSLAWTDSPGTLRQHLDHCADLLRQKLMCDADVGVITYNWVKNHSTYYPNFNTLHKCRNFDDVLTWGRAHQAHRPYGGVVQKPANAVELELPP